jgi:soluble lytic murein transglycosylase
VSRTSAQPRGRNAGARARRSRRWLRIGVAATLGVAAAIGISRIDFEKALRELTLPLRHDDIIRQEAAQRHLDPALVAAVIYAESRFRDQTSPAGARGLMQITPQTARKVSELSHGTAFVTEDLADPDINIAYGCYWLRYLLDRYEGNKVAALAAYNAGIRNADRWGGAKLSLDRIGFEETRGYVEEVLDKRGEYHDKYADDLGLSG